MISGVNKLKNLIKMNLQELEDIRSTVSYLIDSGDFLDGETAYNSAMNSINTLDEAINYIRCSTKLCECGGNARVALDCTSKPCKHPKYYNQ